MDHGNWTGVLLTSNEYNWISVRIQEWNSISLNKSQNHTACIQRKSKVFAVRYVDRMYRKVTFRRRSSLVGDDYQERWGTTGLSSPVTTPPLTRRPVKKIQSQTLQHRACFSLRMVSRWSSSIYLQTNSCSEGMTADGCSCSWSWLFTAHSYCCQSVNWEQLNLSS